MDSEDINYWVWNRLTRAQQLDLRSQPGAGLQPPKGVGCLRVRPARGKLSPEKGLNRAV